MISTGPAQRVTVHLNDDTASEGDYLHLEVMALLLAAGISGATVFRGYSGFGAHQRLHTVGAPGSSGEHLPIRIEFLESMETVKTLMPRLIEIVTDGLIEIQETTIIHLAQQYKPSEGTDHSG